LETEKQATHFNPQTSVKMASHGEELLPDQTEGFKVGEKKTLDEYKNMGKPRSFLILSLLRHIVFKYPSSIRYASIFNMSRFSTTSRCNKIA
jgi:hypothetical protein